MSTSMVVESGAQRVRLRTEPQADRPKILEERRRFKRIDVSLSGRFMGETTEDEYPCEVFNMSPGGMAVRAPFSPRTGERVVAYIEHLGGLEGRVARTFEGGFAVEFKISSRKRERIANVLTWYSSGGHDADDRAHERYEPRITAQKLILPSGDVHDCRVIDVSLSGASIAIRLKPEIDSMVILGRLRGRVVRHHDKGFAIQFVSIQDPDNLARTFG
ncbi:MAG: PilZ domain-containing protein [Methyloceanibacter sp.]|uniref:PilZ domain-containing protein n=1 Tax=Methyloceanibacter sp. TaxID=1965321 RepID=UPI001DAF3784|nr:PilZ domain-containing protein [Methyloceanibacter sp.]MCB1443073.1 PilZ domain-containing protein [Methyloceanibacter sp.]MCC0057697.1 PilZ domain-containing protein [Hyphomicrobiaceae bacterium]